MPPSASTTRGGMARRNQTSGKLAVEWAIQDQAPTVTVLLKAWRGGEDAALGELIPLVHAELYRIARGRMHGERANHSLQATALVNEAYMRLVAVQQVDWQNRTHFLAMAA